MVLNSVSETETPPLNPPPSTPPQPPASPSIFSAKSHPLNNNSSLSNLRWSLNHSNPNHLRTNPENHHRPLSPLQYNQSPHGKLGDWGPRLGPSGLRLSDSGPNPIPRWGSVALGLNRAPHLGPTLPNLTENNNSPRSEDFDLDKLMNDDSGARKGVEKPAEPTEVSKKSVDEKGKSKIIVQVPEGNKGCNSCSGYGTDDGDEAEANTDDAEAELSLDDEEEEPSFVKNWNVREDGEGKKTWNLRPRKAVTKPSPNVNNGGLRNSGRPVQSSKSKPTQAPAPARARPRPRPRAAAGAPNVEAVQKKLMFSLSLTKEEIEEDFIRMTGAKPPKKPKKRAKNVQKQLDACFPGLWLTNVTPDMYRVPDPPLKG